MFVYWLINSILCIYDIGTKNKCLYKVMRLTSIFFQTFKNVITKIIIHNIFMYTNYILAIKVFNLEYYFG